MSTHARPLAERLAAASDAELDLLLRIRGVRADVGWEDFFDAAESLLEPASIERGVAALTATQAQLLRDAVDGRAVDASSLAPLALVDGDGRVPQPVAQIVATKPAIPDAPTPRLTRSDDAAAARSAERAFATVAAVADLLLAARSAPLSLVATGALSATEKRRFADDGDLDARRELAELSGLARAVDRELRVTRDADSWLSAPFAERWTHLVTSFRSALPHTLRVGEGWSDVAAGDGVHPWDPTWPERTARWRHLATRLGLIADDGSEPLWAAQVASGSPVDASALLALLPTEVDKLFLQNDLTAIAPGPLLPVLDNRLRAMTATETSLQTTSYRFTAESVGRALLEGETAESILEFLRTVSLTPVPQPLEYLVSQTAARHGLVRVGPDDTGGTVVSSADENLLEAIEVDRNLRPMGLVRHGDRLVSRVGSETVVWALTDARYPAILVDRDGATVAGTRARVAPEPQSETATFAPLIARLRSRQGPDADAAWLDRELEAAVRARAVVLVEVAMPDGSGRELTLEASGLGGGRLRGLDRTADVERTLPVRSIRSVRVLPS